MAFILKGIIKINLLELIKNLYKNSDSNGYIIFSDSRVLQPCTKWGLY